MKKYNNKIVFIIGFILGAIIFGSVGVYATYSFASSEVTYTENNQTTVKGALDDLYTRANTWINPANMTNSKSITSNGTYDITNYKNVSVNVPNTNSATYTPTSNGTALDMGATNTYRYVNTTTVYNSGVTTGENNIKETWIDPSIIDFTTLATNSKKTILASKNGVCIKRNNKVSCFKINNWNVEQTHIQQVFSDGTCRVNSSLVRCDASDFSCGVYSSGDVNCDDELSDISFCGVTPSGSVNCN